MSIRRQPEASTVPFPSMVAGMYCPASANSRKNHRRIHVARPPNNPPSKATKAYHRIQNTRKLLVSISSFSCTVRNIGLSSSHARSVIFLFLELPSLGASPSGLPPPPHCTWNPLRKARLSGDSLGTFYIHLMVIDSGFPCSPYMSERWPSLCYLFPLIPQYSLWFIL